MDVQLLRGRMASALLLSLLLADASGCRSVKESIDEWWSPTRDGGKLDRSAEKPYETKAATANDAAAGNSPAGSSIQQASHSVPLARPDGALCKALGKDAWALNIALPSTTNLEPTARWRNPAIEPTLRLPSEKRPDLAALIDDKDAIVAANAAILLARWEQGSPTPRLTATVRNAELRMPVRRAAIEALGLVKSPSPAPALRELLKEYGEFAGPAAHSYISELHSDLLVELARHVEVGPQPLWIKALKSPDPQVRIVALRCWSEAVDQSLPAIAVEMRNDSDARVRSAALHMLGKHRDPKAIEHLRRALDDFDLNVRLAAVSALGELGSEEAHATLEKLRQHTSELVRATSVEALAACQADAGVAAAADDKSWRVRLAVATALKNDPAMAGRNPREASRLILKLIVDKNPLVQQTAIAVVAEWPLDQAGPALFMALRDGGYHVRKTAALQLMERWPPAADFPMDGSTDSRITAIERLHAQWKAEFGGLSTAAFEPNIEAPRVTLARLESQFRRQVRILKDDDRLAVVTALPATATPADVESVRGLISQLNDSQLPKTARRDAVQSLRQLGPAVLPALEQLAIDDAQHMPDEVFTEVLPQVHPAFAALDQLRSAEPTQALGRGRQAGGAHRRSSPFAAGAGAAGNRDGHAEGTAGLATDHGGRSAGRARTGRADCVHGRRQRIAGGPPPCLRVPVAAPGRQACRDADSLA